ncbi:MAG: 1-acyl-sn-glycerol-3-phosphate acyltransferase [Ruminococcaceae bacterium]|nr:1-acyl-sn-glycerol-3-phosphate acyltransferase [Oscillospiraceae bacterium]
MKIKVIDKSYKEVVSKEHRKHKRPIKPNMFFRILMKLVSLPDMIKTKFKCEKIGMERLSCDESALYLMNHSSFIDLEVVASVMYPKPFNIVTSTDAFVGKDWLLRHIGCIPTKKFVHDPSLIRDIMHALKKLKSNVVLFPEAGYSFDGKTTTLPESIGKFVKMLGVPVVMIETRGAFLRDPLYNNLQVRRTCVSAKMEYIISPEDAESMTAEQLNEIIFKNFSFDNLKWQQDNRIRISEPTRADYLHRVLYKCPVCNAEGAMLGKGAELICRRCGKVHTLTEFGSLEAADGKPSFTHIPDWYLWERECVREDVKNGNYGFDIPVDILMATDTNRIYRVGDGRLAHSKEGFHLTGCDGALSYEHKPLSSYSINVDFNFYEIGDVISFGNHEAIYYCFPKDKGFPVAKARLAAEELYKIVSEEHSRTNE